MIVHKLKKTEQVFVHDHDEDPVTGVIQDFEKFVSDITGAKWTCNSQQVNTIEIDGEMPEGWLVTFEVEYDWS